MLRDKLRRLEPFVFGLGVFLLGAGFFMIGLSLSLKVIGCGN